MDSCSLVTSLQTDRHTGLEKSYVLYITLSVVNVQVVTLVMFMNIELFTQQL